ncbi:MAG: hypothetical protein JXR76_03540 [Deltaproteobacteria bacterium]|nr:hypothetical protein [Deltaproteobacteria bacterium]
MILADIFSKRTHPARTLFSKCKPLFSDSTFNSSTFRGWSAEGEAFQKKLVLREAKHNNSAIGKYWLLAFSRDKDAKNHTIGDHTTGTLTSRSFTIQHRAIIFRVAGERDWRRVDTSLWIEGKGIYRTKAHCGNKLVPHHWNASAFQGSEAIIKVVEKIPNHGVISTWTSSAGANSAFTQVATKTPQWRL